MMNHSVDVRGAGLNQPPSLHDHDPTATSPNLTRGRVASTGAPTSVFARGPFTVSLSLAK